MELIKLEECTPQLRNRIEDSVRWDPNKEIYSATFKQRKHVGTVVGDKQVICNHYGLAYLQEL